MTNPAPPRPVILCILDGWGRRDERQDNAIAQADTPVWDRFLRDYPHSLLATSGLAVGLPEGQMGNSEVGHMNLGAGRVVMQDLPRIDAAIADGSLAANPKLRAAIDAVKQAGGTMHLLGLLSPGGVHSHQDHLAALVRIISEAGVSVKVHAVLDGRDTPPSSGKGFLAEFLDDIAPFDAEIASISGRYYAMDRDQRWDRVQLAFDAAALGAHAFPGNALDAVQASYDAGKTDEFMLPVSLGGFAGMADCDGLIMGNFRADRAREILHTLVDPDFNGFTRARVPHLTVKLGLTEYSNDLNALMGALFPAENLTQILGEAVSNAGLTQLRIAETEKYAHVTFFFNGGREQVYPGEDRILVPSPKVATYDLQPEMSAAEVADKMIAAIDSGKYDLIVANFANGDMVGHTGIMQAAMKAACAVDQCLGRLEQAVIRAGGVMLLTADHGNAEMMRDAETGQPYTAHTTGPVDVVLVNPPVADTRLGDGCLADAAPTLMALLGLKQPAEMTGASLLRPQPAQHRAAD